MINYNSSNYTVSCVDSIKKSFSDENDYEVIIVDNDSCEIEKKELKTLNKNKNVRIIFSNTNLGFAKANNLAIKSLVKKDIIWFLNNDTLINKKLVQEIENNLPAKNEVLYFDTYDFHDKFNSTGLHCINLLYGNVNIRWKRMPFDVEYICGSSLVMCYDVVMPLWDENFFLYYEDADYSMQLIEKRYVFRHLDGCYINHKIYASTKKLNSINRVRQRSQLIFMKKWGKNYLLFYFVRVCYLLLKGNLKGLKILHQCNIELRK